MIHPEFSNLELLTDLNHEIKLRRDTEASLRVLLQEVGRDPELDFFASLVTRMAAVLNVAYVLVGQLSADRREIQTLAVCADGKLVDNICYGLFGTPCQDVAGQGICVHPAKVQQLFPLDQLLVTMAAESYLGVPLLDHQGQSMGILVALDRQPLSEHNRFKALSLFSVFAARCAAELEHRQMLAQLESRIAERTTALEVRNRELLAAQQHLESTERYLLEAEQLALLGDLVAGIVDEISSPLALSSTSLSCLERGQQRLLQHEQQPLTRSQFTALLGEQSEALRLLRANLSKASLIADRFAHVARRPLPSHRSTIELQRLAEDVISSFSHELQQRSLHCELHCHGPAQLQGHPALLSQVMAQLLHLALTPAAAVQPGSLLLLHSSVDDGHWQCQLTLRSSDSGEQLLALLAQHKVPGERQGPAFSGYLLGLVSKRAGGEFSADSPRAGELRFNVSLPLVN